MVPRWVEGHTKLRCFTVKNPDCSQVVKAPQPAVWWPRGELKMFRTSLKTQAHPRLEHLHLPRGPYSQARPPACRHLAKTVWHVHAPDGCILRSRGEGGRAERQTRHSASVLLKLCHGLALLAPHPAIIRRLHETLTRGAALLGSAVQAWLVDAGLT